MLRTIKARTWEKGRGRRTRTEWRVTLRHTHVFLPHLSRGEKGLERRLLDAIRLPFSQVWQRNSRKDPLFDPAPHCCLINAQSLRHFAHGQKDLLLVLLALVHFSFSFLKTSLCATLAVPCKTADSTTKEQWRTFIAEFMALLSGSSCYLIIDCLFVTKGVFLPTQNFPRYSVLLVQYPHHIHLGESPVAARKRLMTIGPHAQSFSLDDRSF